MEKVLSIVPYRVLPYQNGGQKSIAQFNEFLGAITQLKVISTRDNATEQAKHYQMLGWLPNNLFKMVAIKTLLSIATIIKKENIGFVITEHPYLGWMGYVLGKLAGVKWIVHTHNIEFERFKQLQKKWWPLLKMYEVWVLKNADVVFCISDEDKAYMVQQLQIPEWKCKVIPFGIPIAKMPDDKASAREWMLSKHQIPKSHKILLFNGALGYGPNFDALQVILNDINPLLLASSMPAYTIVVCGAGLPESMNRLADFKNANIVYAGFVNDIEIYFKGADIFLNPISYGGGVKTKLIEALGFGLTVVSTKNGALGCDASTCLEKLHIVPDEDWHAFAAALIACLSIKKDTPPAFYNQYFWGNIVNKALIHFLSLSD